MKNKEFKRVQLNIKRIRFALKQLKIAYKPDLRETFHNYIILSDKTEFVWDDALRHTVKFAVNRHDRKNDKSPYSEANVARQFDRVEARERQVNDIIDKALEYIPKRNN